MIVAGHSTSAIQHTLAPQYGVQPRQIRRYMVTAKQQLQLATAEMDQYRPLILARYEQQYRDCERIDKTETRVRLQRDINDSISRLTGADQPQPKSVNIFQFFPIKDERGRVQVDIPAEYSVDAPGTAQDGPGDDLDDRPIRMLVPGGAR
jgi:multidrug efflux pump subunit AcrB